jgi:hypothetical protein
VTGIQPGSSPSVSLHQHRALTLPAVGAGGFPTSIYPVPPVRLNEGLDIPCPDSAGLRRPGRGIRSAALTVVNRLGRSFQSDLRISDRIYWSQALTNWQGSLSHADEKGGGAVHVLYSGPLESYDQAFRPLDLSQTILAGCGDRTARGTWMIVTGQVYKPARQGEYLLIDRHGHVLLWIAQ